MPSKGVHAYCYISLEGAEVEFYVPGSSIVKGDFGQWSTDQLEVDKSKLKGAFTLSGEFGFKVRRHGQEIAHQHVEINTVTGGLGNGTMNIMADQRSIVQPDFIIAYTFYDAGRGDFGLPNCHQCYVTVCPNRGNWQGEVAPPGSHQAGQPFRKFVLPAAHDIGMNSMETPLALLGKAGAPFINILKFTSNIFSTVADKLTGGVINSIAPDIISGLAVTQKDELDVILQLGARYFEFRPARLHDEVKKYNILPDVFYFTHGPIPGMPLDRFLYDVVAFLTRHHEEMVVIQYRWDGVPDQCGRPNDDDLNNALNHALEQANGSIHAGNLDDMKNASIQELRDQGKRLIVINSVDSLSTYTDEGNATLTGETIVQEFEKLNGERQNGLAFTNIQCQATASNIRDVIIYSAVSADVSNSPLLATKAICDHKTVPWIRDHALDKLTADQLVLIMNDFFDGATADVGVELSKRRLG